MEHPVSIEGLPDGSVLLLDSPAYRTPSLEPPPSRIHHYRMSAPLDEPFTLSGNVNVIDELTQTARERLAVVGYDFAFIPEDTSAQRGALRRRTGGQSEHRLPARLQGVAAHA